MVKIGVLGGIGPDATALFYAKLFEALQHSGKIFSNTDFPQVVVNSIPAPELVHERVTASELQEYERGLRELDAFEPDCIVMVCNTIHLYLERLCQGVSAPILDLRKEVALFLDTLGVDTVTVLGTPQTVSHGLYTVPGVTCLNPTSEELEELGRAVFEFNRGYKKDVQIHFATSVARKYLDAGSKLVVLGCTEFGVMLEKSDLPTLNTVDVLVDAVVRRCIEG